ncbi:hypothetical protein NTG1052_140048 [Candidatus Nitrotoga sp. 1052]|nr:hypothetical protein NTG1052_140048 [Candidatus Nitrotoga sp. 1052]
MLPKYRSFLPLGNKKSHDIYSPISSDSKTVGLTLRNLLAKPVVYLIKLI